MKKEKSCKTIKIKKGVCDVPIPFCKAEWYFQTVVEIGSENSKGRIFTSLPKP
jgi:hypothetical protein